VKTSTSEVEVDLSVNKESENYDEETPLRLTKQTLSSSKAEDVSDYAVGDLKGKLPWISLTYQPAGSNIATKYHDKMISNDGVPIDFTMSKCLHSLVFILSSKKCFNYSLHSLLIATFRKLKCS